MAELQLELGNRPAQAGARAFSCHTKKQPGTWTLKLPINKLGFRPIILGLSPIVEAILRIWVCLFLSLHDVFAWLPSSLDAGVSKESSMTCAQGIW